MSNTRRVAKTDIPKTWNTHGRGTNGSSLLRVACSRMGACKSRSRFGSRLITGVYTRHAVIPGVSRASIDISKYYYGAFSWLKLSNSTTTSSSYSKTTRPRWPPTTRAADVFQPEGLAPDRMPAQETSKLYTPFLPQPLPVSPPGTSPSSIVPPHPLPSSQPRMPFADKLEKSTPLTLSNPPSTASLLTNRPFSLPAPYVRHLRLDICSLDC